MKNQQLQLLVDKRNIRWFQILNKLERISEASTKTLSESLSLATRTITSDIKEIREYFSQVMIIHSTSKGYSIEVTDKIGYIEQKKVLLENEPLLAILAGIFYGETRSIFDWSDRLFLTDRTLTYHLKQLTPLLERYQLKMDYQNLSLEGEEIDIRNFFLAIFYEDDTIPHSISPPIMIQKISQEFSYEAFDYFHLTIPYFKFSYLLFISYQRILLNCPINLNETVFQALIKSPLLKKLDSVKELFEKHTGLTLTQQELAYLVLTILDSLDYTDKPNKFPLILDDLPESLETFVTDFCLNQRIPLNYECVAYVQSFFYMNYLKSTASPTCLLNSSSLNTYFNKGSFDELKEIEKLLMTYPDNFWMAQITEFKLTVFLFTLDLHYKVGEYDHVIAFIFEGPSAACLLFEEIARHHMPKNHTLYFFNASTFTKDCLLRDSIDLVVTNFSEYIFEYVEDIDYLLFNFIPTSEDWNNLIVHLYPRMTQRFKFAFTPIDDE